MVAKKNLQKILEQAECLMVTLKQECGSYEQEQCQELIDTIKDTIKK